MHEIQETKPPLNLKATPLALKDVSIQQQGDFYVLDELNFQHLWENNLKVLWSLREYQIILNSYQNYYDSTNNATKLGD